MSIGLRSSCSCKREAVKAAVVAVVAAVVAAAAADRLLQASAGYTGSIGIRGAKGTSGGG